MIHVGVMRRKYRNSSEHRKDEIPSNLNKKGERSFESEVYNCHDSKSKGKFTAIGVSGRYGSEGSHRNGW